MERLPAGVTTPAVFNDGAHVRDAGHPLTIRVPTPEREMLQTMASYQRERGRRIIFILTYASARLAYARECFRDETLPIIFGASSARARRGIVAGWHHRRPLFRISRHIPPRGGHWMLGGLAFRRNDSAPHDRQHRDDRRDHCQRHRIL